ncbi:YaiI/YqxD family protein [Aurantivibrio plasticivorans]
MQIWVDADACPVVIREILLRAAQRVAVPITFVANSPLQLPSLPTVKFVQVAKGFDIADNLIAQSVEKNDLVITSDIPLAAEVVDKHGVVITSRGEKLTAANVRARLNMRDFMETMRSSGLVQSKTPSLSQSDRQQFANQLDRWLNQFRSEKAKNT